MTNDKNVTMSREKLRQEFEAANSDRAWFVQGGTSESDTPEGFVYGDFTTDMCWTCYFEARRVAPPVVERQEPAYWEYRSTSLGDQVENRRMDHFWLKPDAEHEHDYIKGEPLYRSPPAQVAVALPERNNASLNLNEEQCGYVDGWNACLDKVKELNNG